MKKLDTTNSTMRDFDEVISKFSENVILDLHAMNNVRGGDGEGDGGADLIIIPKKPLQPVKIPNEKGALFKAPFLMFFGNFINLFSEIVP